MDRICIRKIDGSLVEMQSGGDDRPELMEARLNTLLNNAIKAGFREDEVEVKWIGEEESKAIIAPSAQEIAKQEALAELERIDKKSIRAIREMLAGDTNAPQKLKDCEAQAIEARGRLHG